MKTKSSHSTRGICIRRADGDCRCGVCDASFARRLRLAVKCQTQSPADLARSAGVSEATLRVWIKGRRPSSSKIGALAGALGVESAWLVSGRGQMNPVHARLGPPYVPGSFDAIQKELQELKAALIQAINRINKEGAQLPTDAGIDQVLAAVRSWGLKTDFTAILDRVIDAIPAPWATD